MQNKQKNYNRWKPKILRLLLDIVVFRLVMYLPNMICLIIRILYNIAYIYEFSSKGVEPLQQTRNFLIPISVQLDQIFLV